GLTILTVRDEITDVQVGSKPDPNNPSAQAAAIVQGSEYEREQARASAATHTSRPFDVLLWLVWSTSAKRYLLCDTADS
ncbi:MAG TPA: hypothetical protein VI138_08360, partial [Candidatus Dormibacteraeota bacterium]